MAAENYR